MQNLVLSLIMNLAVAGLLLATMVYCRKLNTRIRILQDSKSELARIVREFDESTQRATQSIAEIHEATRRISENIQLKIDKANFLADDLQYMIEKGNKLTGKTDNSPIRPGRAEAEQAASRPAAAPTASPSAAAEMVDITATAGRRPLRARSRAEQEIMSALGKKTTEPGQ